MDGTTSTLPSSTSPSGTILNPTRVVTGMTTAATRSTSTVDTVGIYLGASVSGGLFFLLILLAVYILYIRKRYVHNHGDDDVTSEANTMKSPVRENPAYVGMTTISTQSLSGMSNETMSNHSYKGISNETMSNNSYRGRSNETMSNNSYGGVLNQTMSNNSYRGTSNQTMSNQGYSGMSNQPRSGLSHEATSNPAYNITSDTAEFHIYDIIK